MSFVSRLTEENHDWELALDLVTSSLFGDFRGDVLT